MVLIIFSSLKINIFTQKKKKACRKHMCKLLVLKLETEKTAKKENTGITGKSPPKSFGAKPRPKGGYRSGR